MNLRQLEYVVAVADSLSFTEAAKRCNIVQSALSHQIRRLENDLGTQLFERSSRRVRLTPAGELLVEYGRVILGKVEEARVELDALAGLERGKLAIGTTQTSGRVLDVMALFEAFYRRHPGISLSSISGPFSELVEGVRSGALDLAFVSLDSSIAPTDALGGGLEWQVLVEREPLVAVVGLEHALADVGQVGLAHLAESGGFVEFRAGTGLRATVDDAFKALGISRRIIMELGRISDMVRFASHGSTAAIVPVAFARHAPAGAAPIRALHLPIDLAMAISAVHRPGRQGAALRAFLEVLRAESLGRSISEADRNHL